MSPRFHARYRFTFSILAITGYYYLGSIGVLVSAITVVFVLAIIRDFYTNVSYDKIPITEHLYDVAILEALTSGIIIIILLFLLKQPLWLTSHTPNISWINLLLYFIMFYIIIRLINTPLIFIFLMSFLCILFNLDFVWLFVLIALIITLSVPYAIASFIKPNEKVIDYLKTKTNKATSVNVTLKDISSITLSLDDCCENSQDDIPIVKLEVDDLEKFERPEVSEAYYTNIFKHRKSGAVVKLLSNNGMAIYCAEYSILYWFLRVFHPITVPLLSPISYMLQNMTFPEKNWLEWETVELTNKRSHAPLRHCFTISGMPSKGQNNLFIARKIVQIEREHWNSIHNKMPRRLARSVWCIVFWDGLFRPVVVQEYIEGTVLIDMFDKDMANKEFYTINEKHKDKFSQIANEIEHVLSVKTLDYNPYNFIMCEDDHFCYIDTQTLVVITGGSWWKRNYRGLVETLRWIKKFQKKHLS